MSRRPLLARLRCAPRAPLGALVALLAGAGLAACEGQSGNAYARRVTTTTDLIGGPGALGTVGDWSFGNQEMRIILQDKGWSRGFGIFGGGIIDADLVRAGSDRSEVGFGSGRDNFGEFFPALFLQAFDVADVTVLDDNGNEQTLAGIEVLNDGSDGGAAIVRTRALGGDFFTLIKELIDQAVPEGLRFETDYIVQPGTRHVEIVGRLINTNRTQSIELPDPALLGLLGIFGVTEFTLPLGDVALFGAGNTVFAPGAVHRPNDPLNPKPAGFDLRFAIEASYANPRDLPALPGLVTPFLATAGEGVSYGYAVGDSDNNFVWQNRTTYQSDPQTEVTTHSLLVPFLISSFTGAFYEVPPAVMAPGEVFEYRKFFIVGTGDVASIRDELYRIRGSGTGRFAGRVLDEGTGEAAQGVWVHVFDEQQRPFSQITPDAEGRFQCRLEPGTYYWLVTGEGRHPYGGGEGADPAGRFSEANRFTVSIDEDAYAQIEAPRPATLIVNVRDENGRPVPAKVSALLPYDISDECAACEGSPAECIPVCEPRNYLFDLSLGEHRRPTDLNWYDPVPHGGQMIEEVLLGTTGEVKGAVRPTVCDAVRCTPYTLVVSRGPEYDTATVTDVELRAGEVKRVDVRLNRVVDTSHYVSADLHIHAIASADAHVPLDVRVTSGVAEGLELLVATDHNVITDYEPAITELGLQDWVAGVVGVELTTLEAGHFNAFPMAQQIDAPSSFPFVEECFAPEGNRVNRTAFDWVQCAPDQLFDQLRQLGQFGPNDVIVQVNHPRDTILGYFNQYYVNPYTLEAEIPNGNNYPFVELIRPHNDATHQYDPDKFSWNFDALEVLNGKRLDQLHAFRTPVDVPDAVLAEIANPQCLSGHQLNGPGQVLLREGGHIAYPGVFDDWMRLLNRGIVITGTANSDSHELAEEIGTPRTYLYLPPGPDGVPRDNRPGLVHPLDLVETLREHRALGTNGPFLTMTVVTTDPADDSSVIWPVGSLVPFARDYRGRDITVILTVRSAPWVDVDRIVLYGNGEVIDVIDIPEEVDAFGVDVDDAFSLPRTFQFTRDTVLVAEAMGDRSMFPVIAPREEPPVNIAEAIGAILSSIGGAVFGSNDGVSGPGYIQRVTPYAFTNPIWLDITGPQDESCQSTECPEPDGVFNPPGNPPGPGPAISEPPGDCDANLQCPPGQTCNTGEVPPRCECVQEEGPPPPPTARTSEGPSPLRYRKSDIRRLFAQHLACPH